MMTQEQPTATNPRIEICCRIDSSMLGLLRDFVTAVANYLGFSARETSEIEICVDEACANALEHAYKPDTNTLEPNKELVIEICFHDGELTIRVIDHGCGISEPQARIASLDEYLAPEKEKFRGLGLYMIQKFMDRVNVHSEPGKGTIVEMTKVRR
ncbi:MAG: ATP-binding protein [Candidatus Sumerlaeaceae bacterium]|nr:ATP-binding protein [Candidatus Sumerlaeaceae bacterium]